jgi:hypothetical protein
VSWLNNHYRNSIVFSLPLADRDGLSLQLFIRI